MQLSILDSVFILDEFKCFYVLRNIKSKFPNGRIRFLTELDVVPQGCPNAKIDTYVAVQ